MIAESQRKPKTDLSLVIYDLDDFRLINRKFDITVGDEMLWKFAKILRENVPRSTDFIARSRSMRYPAAGETRKGATYYAFPVRYGGEEFTSVHQKMKKERVYRKAEKIRKRAEKNAIEYKEKGETIYLGTVSIGIGEANDIDQIKILFDTEGNKLVIGPLKGKYKKLIKDFSKETGIEDGKVDDYLKVFRERAKGYLERMEIELTPREALLHDEYGSQLRNYLAAMSFISEVDKRGLQVSKNSGKNTITML